MSFLAYLVATLGAICSLILFAHTGEPGWLVAATAIVVVHAAFARVMRRLGRIESDLAAIRAGTSKSSKAIAVSGTPCSSDLEGTLDILNQRRKLANKTIIGTRLGSWEDQPQDKASA